MAISTVNVDFSAILQNAAQATGLLRVRLSQVGTVEDSETGDKVILPIAWQETTLTDGAATLALVPNKLIEPSCTYYEIQLKSVPDCPKACAKLLLSGIMYVPDEDCNVLDLLISPPSPETANTASGYASQAKQAAQVAENFAIQAGDRYDDVAEAAATALTDIGTAKQDALDAIGTAQSGATEAISTAEDAALQAIGQARGTALDDIGTAQGTAIGAVQAEGNTQVGRVYDAGEDAVADVTAAQATAVSAVQAQQATSVAAVSAEGTAQVNAVTQAGNGYVATMQGLVSDAQAARDAAQTAQGLAEDAQAAAESASTDAQGYAGDASTSAGQAAQSASDAADSATAAQASADSIAASAEQIQTNERNITNIQALLNGTLYREETDSTAAYSKTVPTGAMPYASINEIGGKTVVWNQLLTVLNSSQSKTLNGVSLVDNRDGTYTVSTEAGGATANAAFTFTQTVANLQAGHKYLYRCTPAGGSTTTYYAYLVNNSIISYTRDIGNGCFYTASGSGVVWEVIYVASGTVITIPLVFKPRLFDLTLMFGAGNEPATVAEFEAMFPSIDPAYNAGELMSAGVTEAVSEGRNLCDLDAVWSGISSAVKDANDVWVLSSLSSMTNIKLWENDGTYQGQISYSYQRKDSNGSAAGYRIQVVYEDNTTAVAGTSAFQADWVDISATTPSGKKVAYLRGMYNSNQTCYIKDVLIEKSSDSTDYVPYRSPVSLPIPSAIQSLPGYGWSAGTAYNVVSLAQGKNTQRVGEIDLGKLNWSYSTEGSERFYAPVPDIKYYGNGIGYSGGLLCSYGYTPMFVGEAVSYTPMVQRVNATDKVIWQYTTASGVPNICIRDTAYSEPATFKAAMQGVMLYYELATPIETDISEYLTGDNLIEVEPGGSLTFKNQHGDDWRVPVPNEETYLVQATPELPTTDGTYTLQCTVTDGTPSVTWVTA